MSSVCVGNTDEAIALVNRRGLSHIKVGFFDNDGVMRGKYMSREKFISALTGGFSFCDVVLGWDCQDQLYDNARYTGWHTGYPDAPVRIIPETCRAVINEPGMLLFLCEFTGEAAQVCPRGTLIRVIQRAADMGFSVKAACEYEFFVFQETPDSIREKGYRDLKPLTPDAFGYSMIRNSVHSDLYHQVLEMSELMGFPIESMHTETGPGVIEVALGVDSILNAADKAALFKTFTKVLAEHNGLMATFMARWSSHEAGQSGHLHLSMTDAVSDEPVFYQADEPYGISQLQRRFIAGQQACTADFMAMLAPTINSYSRLLPGYWAPTEASWGIENRTCAFRVISGNARSQRVECRIGAAGACPYLALAAALAAGLYGVEHRLEPTDPVIGNAYSQEHPAALSLPSSLEEAARIFEQSGVAREYLGDVFVDHYAATRQWEVREFRKHITDWELARYFEII